MSKVWIVERTPCIYESSYGVMKVFADKKSADEWCDQMSRKESDRFARWRVSLHRVH